MSARQRIGRRLLCTAVAITLTACMGTEPAWSPVDLPGVGAVVALAPAGSGLLVGRYAPNLPVRSSIDLVDTASGTVTGVSLGQGPGYAAEARLLSISARADHVIAVGGARGGAHGNVRWTVWAGDVSGLHEQPQPFETFGGWGAGTLVGTAYSKTGPIIMGSWVAESGHGFDVAVWHQDGDRWIRVAGPGPVLDASDTRQPAVAALTATRESYVAVGSVTVLGVRTRAEPTSWVAESPGGPWREIPLPVRRAVAESVRAVGLSCAPSHCVIVGRRGSDILAWRLELGTSTAGTAVVVAGGVTEEATVAAAAAPGGDWVAVAEGPTTHLVRVGGGRSGSLRISGRLGTVATDSSGRAVLATSGPDGTTRLWRSPD